MAQKDLDDTVLKVGASGNIDGVGGLDGNAENATSNFTPAVTDGQLETKGGVNSAINSMVTSLNPLTVNKLMVGAGSKSAKTDSSLGTIKDSSLYNHLFNFSYNPDVVTTIYTQFIGAFDFNSGVATIEIHDQGSLHSRFSTFIVGRSGILYEQHNGLDANYTLYFRVLGPETFELFFVDNQPSLNNTITYSVYVTCQGAIAGTTVSVPNDTGMNLITPIYLLNGPNSEASKNGNSILATPSLVFSSQSTLTDQVPSTLNVPELVNFGPNQSTTNVDLTANVFTFNTEGVYYGILICRVAREFPTDYEGIMFQLNLNGSAMVNMPSEEVVIEDDLVTKTCKIMVPIEKRSAGDTISLEMAATLQGGGLIDIGLYQQLTVPTGFNTAPTASVLMYKYS